MRAGPDAVGRDGEPDIGQVGVQADDDGIGVTGRGEAVDPLLADPGRGISGADHVVALVAQLAFEAARAEDQDAPDLRIVLAEIERGRARGGNDRLGRDRRAHRGQTRLVLGPVMHRVVGHVDDVVATCRAIGEHRGDARNGVSAAVHDAIEVDQEEAGPSARS